MNIVLSIMCNGISCQMFDLKQSKIQTKESREEWNRNFPVEGGEIPLVYIYRPVVNLDILFGR